MTSSNRYILISSMFGAAVAYSNKTAMMDLYENSQSIF